MFDLSDVQRELTRYTYRPGWELVAEQDEWEGSTLWIVAEVPNAYSPDKSVTLRIRSLIPPMQNALQFGQWLSWRLQQVETHESREWLHYDDKPLFDPHREHAPPHAQNRPRDHL